MLSAMPVIAATSVSKADSGTITWRKNKTADASVDQLPLPKMLSRLSSATGWKILVQPGIDHPVSVQFRNASQADALKLLLGNLSYALVPQPGGGARLYVYKTSLSDATSLIQPELSSRPKNWLANEMIVSLAPGSKVDVDKLAAELGGKVVAKSEALNAYRLEFPDAATAEAARQKTASREDLASHDNYSFDRPTLSGSGTPSPQSLFPLDAKPVTRGDQVLVALIDTPVQPLSGKMNDFLLPSIQINETAASQPVAQHEPTHATSMASTLLTSLAFNRDSASADLGKVRVQPIDIYGSSGSTDTFRVAEGLYAAINKGAQIINLSLGGTGQSPMVDYLLEMAHTKGILVFASAGNSPTTDPTYPAANPHTIAVTAADWEGNIAAYANRGTFVDVKAPGSSKVYFNGQTYVSTGTSTATAFISGQAAALAAQGMDSSQTANAILKNFNINATSPKINR